MTSCECLAKSEGVERKRERKKIQREQAERGGESWGGRGVYILCVCVCERERCKGEIMSVM